MNFELEDSRQNFINPNAADQEEKGFSLASFLVKKKIVSDYRKANILLLSVSVIIIVISVLMAYFVLRPEKVVNYEDLPLSEKMKISPELRETLDRIQLDNQKYGN
ncbi:MAG TPA: hypothetical protein P5328_02530 [Candidatus Paceibacterota bacterium]|nr:hypothetical protein [Candidatus Paceibacterota bacterium]HRZ34320.1 hypothetical protein [Candidatus Paceibacterota bacterium]